MQLLYVKEKNHPRIHGEYTKETLLHWYFQITKSPFFINFSARINVACASDNA